MSFARAHNRYSPPKPSTEIPPDPGLQGRRGVSQKTLEKQAKAIADTAIKMGISVEEASRSFQTAALAIAPKISQGFALTQSYTPTSETERVARAAGIQPGQVDPHFGTFAASHEFGTRPKVETGFGAWWERTAKKLGLRKADRVESLSADFKRIAGLK